MRFTVRASIDKVAHLAARNDCDCDLFETDSDDMTVVEMQDEPLSRFARVLNAVGYVWHTGLPRMAHADPTFARAAQRVDNPDRIVADGEVW